MMNRSSSAPQIYIPDAGNQEQVETNPQIEVRPTFAPHFGLVYRPLGTSKLEVSSSVHLPSQAPLTGRGELRFWDFEYPEGATELKQPFDLMFLDEPLRISLGLKGTISLSSNRNLELYGDLLWAEWSTYTDRHVERPPGLVRHRRRECGNETLVRGHILLASEPAMSRLPFPSEWRTVCG